MHLATTNPTSKRLARMCVAQPTLPLPCVHCSTSQQWFCHHAHTNQSACVSPTKNDLVKAMQSHHQLVDLEGKGHELDPHDPCAENNVANGKQHTVTFHVDDSKCSHVCKTANNLFAKWLDTKCVDDEIGRAKAVRGKHHDRLGMKLDFSSKGKLKVDM